MKHLQCRAVLCAGWLTKHKHIFSQLYFAVCIDLASKVPVHLDFGNITCAISEKKRKTDLFGVIKRTIQPKINNTLISSYL